MVRLHVIVHEAEEGGYWAEVPAIPGCVAQGESMAELLANVREAVKGCRTVEIEEARAAIPESGLASIAGGWEGSDELVRILETSPRTEPRQLEDGC